MKNFKFRFQIKDKMIFDYEEFNKFLRILFLLDIIDIEEFNNIYEIIKFFDIDIKESDYKNTREIFLEYQEKFLELEEFEKYFDIEIDNHIFIIKFKENMIRKELREKSKNIYNEIIEIEYISIDNYL